MQVYSNYKIIPTPFECYHFCAGVPTEGLAPKGSVGDADAEGQDGEEKEDRHDPNHNILLKQTS